MATGPVRASWDIGATKYGREYETIQEAIDGLPTVGGVVQIPSGTWALLTGLTIPTDRRVEIVGSGGGTILNSTAAITILTADSTTGFILKDIRFTGTPTTALSIQSATNPGLSNIRFELTSGTAIDTTGATSISYNNVWNGTTLLNSPEAYETVQEEGVAVTARRILNFIGGAITAADNVGATRTDVTLSASPDSASVVGTGRTISTSGAALTGGGDLSANRTVTLSASPDSLSVVGTGRNINVSGTALSGGGDLSVDRTITLSQSPVGSVSVVGTGRLVSTSGTALTGGGDLSMDRTITLSQSPLASASVVGIGRLVSTSGAALTGGGDLSTDRTIALLASPDSVSVVGTGRQVLTSGTALSGGGDLTADRTITLSQSPAASASVVGTGRNVSTGAGLSGGGDLSADRTLTWAPDTQVNSITVFDSSQASRTVTFGLSGAADPVLTAANNSLAITSARVGIGTTTAPPTELFIVGSTGAARLQTSETDATAKEAMVVGGHHTNAEEAVLCLRMRSDGTDNLLLIGGSTGTYNAATQVSLYTGATATTTAGTERLRVTSAGNVDIRTGDLVLTSHTTATSATGGVNGDVPAQVVGYLVVSINGTSRKIPFYAT